MTVTTEPIETVSGPAETDRPRLIRSVTPAVLTEIAIAAGAGVAFAFTLRYVFDWNGILGTVIWAYVAFLVALYALSRDRESPEIAIDRMVTTVVWSIGAVVTAVLAWMLIYLVVRGTKVLRVGFLTHDMATVGPTDTGGGALHAIIGTLEQVGIAVVVVVPLAVLTAVYLNELKGPLARPARFVIDAMSGLPSIVAGLLVYTLWVGTYGYSGFAASLALIVLMLPTVTRTAEEVLRTVPDILREGSLALGAPRWRVIMRVVLPTARAGLLTAVILGVARAVGETAPIVLTAFGASEVNTNPFSGPQNSLPLFAFRLLREPNVRQVDRGWAALLILVLLVLMLFVLARWIGSRGDRRLGRRR